MGEGLSVARGAALRPARRAFPAEISPRASNQVTITTSKEVCLPPKPRNLPEDPAALKALLRAAQAERDRAEQRAAEHAQRAQAQAALAQEKAALAAQQTQRADELYLENLRLQLQLERYQKWYYGPRADRLKTREELGQALLAFGEERAQKPAPPDEAAAASEPAAELRRVKRRRGRRALANFENLPVTTHVYELSPEERACPGCGLERKEIGRGRKLADRVRARPLRAPSASPQEVRLCALRSGGGDAADHA